MRLKSATTIILALMMILSAPMNAFAMEFVDINEAPWAGTHIERMAEKGVVSGSIHPTTGQRVYRPNSPVTKVESIVMLYSILQKTEQLSSTTDYTSKYQTMLTSAMIPEWAQKQMGYALENGIITTGNLSGFMTAGNPDPVQNPAAREEVAVYFGRALDNNNQAPDASISLPFGDTESISSTALPYVNLMVKQGIISGDDQNRFNPRATITRAEMAALANKTFDVLEKEEEVVIDLTPVTPEKPEELPQSIYRKTGELQRVNQDTGVIFVYYEDENMLEMYQVTRDTVIRINNADHELINLRQGQEVELTFSDKDDLLRIEINPRRTYYHGKVVQIVDLIDYYAITLESLSSSDRVSFQVDRTTEILIDGVRRTISSLRTGDQVRLQYAGQRALSIEKGVFDEPEEEDEQLVDGILESAVNFNRSPFTIQVKLLNNQIREYEIDEDVTIRIDDSRGYLEELIKGDIVTLTIDPAANNQVTRIEALGLESTRKLEGVIDSLTISRNVQLQFTVRNGNTQTFTVTESARIYSDNERIDIRDLRLPAEATIFLEGELVVEVEASRSFGSQVIQGRIVRFRDSINMMTVRQLTTANTYEETSVYITDSTIVIGKNGETLRLRDLGTQFEVLVTGVYDGDAFIADRILVVSE